MRTGDVTAIVNKTDELIDAVNNGSTVDDNNTTTTPLVADAVFTGTATDITHYAGIAILVEADQAGTLTVQFSGNGTDWHEGESYDILANATKFFTPPAQAQYFRIVYTNGDTDQTEFHLHTVLKKYPIRWSAHNIDDPIEDQDDAELVKSVITGKKANGVYDNVSLTNGANMKISLEELESGISTNSNSQLKTTIYDEGGIPASVDDSTESLQIIDYEHHEIHSGSHYFVDGYQDLSINQVMDFTWQMPDTLKWIHWTWNLAVESETLYQIYELAVATNPLANTVTPFNNNRNSTNTSGTIMKFEVQTNLAAANADTSVATATLLASGIIGAGKNGGFNSRSRELVMKQGALYLLRSTANAAGYQNFVMDWYEHTDKH